SRHVEGAAEVAVDALFPIYAREPMEPATLFGDEPQLVRPTPRVVVVGEILQSGVAAGEARRRRSRIQQRAVVRIGEAGEPLLRSAVEVLLVLRVLVELAPLLAPVGAGEDQVGDADVTVHMEVHHVRLEQLRLRTETRDGPRRQCRILVPGPAGVLALEAIGEPHAPPLGELQLERRATALAVLTVVVFARPLRVARDRAIHPGACRQCVVYEPALGI